MPKKINPIIKVLMERDGCTYEEAKEIFEDTRAEIADALAGTNVLSIEEILYDNLGLELDYIWDLI